MDDALSRILPFIICAVEIGEVALAQNNNPSEPKTVCGVVMPISAIDNCTEAHWSDVYEILSEAIEEAGFSPNLVSNADDVGIIQKRIIQNLYDNPIVVCDVSGKNPNVMFELGLRLAFDKPTIIVKDDKTTYSFDTAPIEHLEYPRDLRFGRIVEFRQKLTDKIRATNDKASADSSYTTFLKHFGEFTVAKLDKKEVPGQEYILEELRSLRLAIQKSERAPEFRRRDWVEGDVDICAKGWSQTEIEETVRDAKSHPDVKAVTLNDLGNHEHIIVNLHPVGNPSEIRQLLSRKKRMPPRMLRKSLTSRTETSEK